jgi:aryl-alcohol dehydrogenase-like predicted oxidoreductase
MKNKLALGAVQFDINYGSTNQNGEATLRVIKNILNFAKANGVDTLDAAAVYGNSEQVLGEVGRTIKFFLDIGLSKE